MIFGEDVAHPGAKDDRSSKRLQAVIEILTQGLMLQTLSNFVSTRVRIFKVPTYLRWR